MFKVICLVLLSVIAVYPNPIAQLACSACKPYSNQATPSNNNAYAQSNTVQVPSLPAPIGNSLNQLLLNKILLNPSLQKIIDPNTRLFNQNGNEVPRQARNTGSPNVINNYFIVPPEFFNLNETDVEINKEKSKNDKDNKKQKKRRPKDEELDLDDEEIVEKKTPVIRRKVEPEAKKKKSKQRELDITDEFDDEVVTRKQRENPKNERQNKTKQRKNTLEEDNDEAVETQNEIEEINRVRTRNPKSRRVIEEEVDTTKNTETIKSKKKKKDRQTKVEPPTNNPGPANKSRKKGSKRNSTKKGPEQKSVRTVPKERNTNPFPEDVLRGFFPYMPMGNYYDPYSYYPYNFNQYNEYYDPVRNNNGNKNKKKPKNRDKERIASENNKEQNRNMNTQSNHKKQNKKNNTLSNTHTIEIQLQPIKKENNNISTENPEEKIDTSEKVTVEEVKTPESNTLEDLKESEDNVVNKSVEEITKIPMEKPHKVSLKEVETASKESYETYSKLENLLDSELGEEAEVPTFNYNDIINDYYPRFDDDDYFNPDAENLDNRYFYETENVDRKKLDRYEASRSQRDDSRQMLENSDFKTKKVRKVDNKNEEKAIPEHDILKSSAEIIRVKIPAKNIRPKVENIETVFAGSKVAKYGVADSVEDISVQVEDSEESSDEIYPTYIIAKSIGRPEDYY